MEDVSEVTCIVSDCVAEFCSVGGILKGGEGNESVVPNKEEEKPKNFRPNQSNFNSWEKNTGIELAVGIMSHVPSFLN